MHRRGGGSGGQVGQAGKRFFLDRDEGHVVSGAARGVEDEEGETAVAGDQTETHG